MRYITSPLDKLGYRHLYNCHQVEVVQPSIAFDVASLLLYGTQAIPVRLKILLDRLFSVLQREEVLQVLHGFGWTYEDYARGYIAQDPSGTVLDKWLLASKEEEVFIFQQFLRFSETKSIAQQLLLQESGDKIDCVVTPPATESDIKKFIERTNNRGTLFKHHSNSLYDSTIYPAMPSIVSPSKSLYRHTSSVSSTQSNISSTVSSPIDCTSPIALSPLNRLQNMQPHDYRRDSPELVRSDKDKMLSVAVPAHTSLNSPTSVPNICFTTSSLPHIPNTNNSYYVKANSERSFNEEDVSEDDDGDRRNGAINLTRHSLPTSYMDSVYAAKKIRHLRKSANPMKRKWNPTVLATLAMNPATGKKRVQCGECYKTFCDKGALKIHYSAVHLREMHKCTVEGCNMMFSSRRSRNRHSANPNPKLHTPNCRRKINPHDGRTANPFPVPPGTFVEFPNSFASYPPGQMEGESNSFSDDDDQMTMVPRVNSMYDHNVKGSSLIKTEDRLPEPDDVPLSLTKKIRMEDDVNEPSKCNINEGIDLSLKECSSRRIADVKDSFSKEDVKPEQNTSSEEKAINAFKQEDIEADKPTTESKENFRMELENGKMHTLPNNPDSEILCLKSETKNFTPKSQTDKEIREASHAYKKLKHSDTESSLITNQANMPLMTKGVRKRKSLNPIRCPAASDDDLPFVSSDDSSSDTYIDQDNDENGLLDSKSDYLTSDGSDSMNDLDELEDNSATGDKRDCANSVNKSSQVMTSSTVNSSRASNLNDASEQRLRDHEQYNGFSVSDLSKTKSSNQIKSEDISENPLRHLESLSLGAFTNMLNVNNRTNFNQRGVSVSSGVSYHAPGLGLASVTTTTAPNRAESPVSDVMPTLTQNSVSHAPPLTSSCTFNNSDTDNSMSENQLPMVPVFRDASMIGSLEIPVDKENPRRCTACGKIFQNHFGVKTHYQNVHLKVMHKCTVDGCNASFPSKRSRDRHSSNMNLHRKLLSTTSDRSNLYFDKASAVYPFHTDSYSRDLFSRFHEQGPHPLAAMEYYSRLQHDGATPTFLNPYTHLPGAIPGYHPAFYNTSAYTTFKNDATTRYNHENSGRNSSLSSISNPSSPGPSSGGSPKEHSSHQNSVKLDEELSPDHDGRFVCTICEKKFHERVVLREHYEKSHTKELLECSTNGCNKVFLSRQSRNVHSDNLHKDKSVEDT
ncbi:zinc finger protein basonuclin-2 isoform X2 [Parasteatoda tepidariorum]|uniref:zinc finger protein basonuclin-2 isoform X2 n=1 Tax=Parasteatoda tepidariorum TaxID=114398 RepID=UPI00077FA808|nr:zinc finger protein basonuclin-1 isoform X2 [Parasteatoda tepidariorum]